VVKVSEPLLVSDALEVFDQLVPYVKRIQQRASGVEPGALRILVADGCVTLHSVGDDGYMIASWEKDEMFVICAGTFDLYCSNFSAHISAAADYAKQHNCSKLSFRSGRLAWRKVALANGFTKVNDYFTKELL